MSRIFGIISDNPPAEISELNRKMDSASVRGWAVETNTDSFEDTSFAGGACFSRTKSTAQDEKFFVLCDGELFNTAEFAGYSSLPQLILEYANRDQLKELLSKLNGDFAFAVYNREAKSLFLARDRVGVRPLYFARNGKHCAFASRLAALQQVPWVSSTVNPQYVALFAGCHYRTFDNDRNASPFKNVSQLPAAHFALIQGDRIDVSCFWSLEENSDFESAEQTLAEQYRELLFDAVHIRLKAHKNRAFTLSGGMDSSSVLASAVSVTGDKQEAFSTTYEDATYDESDEIQSMLDKHVSNWHRVEVGTPHVFELVEKLVELHDEPIATATWLSHFLLCQEVSAKGFDSLFGGLGGDELNAGEYEYFFYFFADLAAKSKSDLLNQECSAWVKHHDHPIFRKDKGVMEEGLKRLVDLDTPGRCLPDKTRILRYASTLNSDFFELEQYSPIMHSPFESYLKNRTYQDIFFETAPCCLRAEDRQSSAYGIRNVLPFFDYRLLEFMFQVNENLKIRDGVTKILLRQAMKDVLPDETRNRIKKTGWNAPAHQWFSGKGGDMLGDIISSQKFKERGIYNIQEVQKLLHEHQQIIDGGLNRDNHMMFFWQLLNLDCWLKDLGQ